MFDFERLEQAEEIGTPQPRPPENITFFTDIGRLVTEGRLGNQQGKKLMAKLGELETEFMKAADDGEDVEVIIKRIQLRIEEECDGMTSICPIGGSGEAFNGLIKEGKWMRVRNGITMDSGCSVFVMPSDWLTMFALEESAGSRSGQTYTAAAKGGKPILNEGQRTIKFFTQEGEKKKVTCQVAGVNKILASVALICDNGNHVIFRDVGGEIVNDKTGAVTPFRRHGNIYVLDAWIPLPGFDPEPKGKSDEMLSFTRQSGGR